jgi:protein-tyrosine phosphatase
MPAVPHITNPSNFRDLASHVRPRVPLRTGRLFRSDHLGALNADDARQIEALGIRRVLDFRGVYERCAAACAVQGVTVHSLAIEPTIVQKLSHLLAAGTRLTEADVVALMEDTYRGFVRRSTHRFAEFFGHLLESDQPTVFHCTAGKDRTGFAAALVLHAVGASPDEVMRDYLLTNERFKPGAWSTTLPPQVARVLYRVQPEFLQAAFEAAAQDYGSLDGYLDEGLGLGPRERDRLAALYLEAGR